MLIVLESILWVIRFFFGACIFSFLNVVIDRLPRAESVVNGRSHCTNCGRVLHAWELIPCVSYIYSCADDVQVVKAAFREEISSWK